MLPLSAVGFKDIKISLQSTDIRKTVSTILQSCGLPLDYINTVPVTQKSQRIKWYTYNDLADWSTRAEDKYKAPAQRTLR